MNRTDSAFASDIKDYRTWLKEHGMRVAMESSQSPNAPAKRIKI